MDEAPSFIIRGLCSVVVQQRKFRNNDIIITPYILRSKDTLATAEVSF